MNKKIKRVIHHYHVFSVITILFDEIIRELVHTGHIKIHNFGTLALNTLKPRKYYNVIHQQVMESKGHRILRFTLAPLVRKKIVAHLDPSFKDD